jgi:hypothetical protein
VIDIGGADGALPLHRLDDALHERVDRPRRPMLAYAGFTEVHVQETDSDRLHFGYVCRK